jgi:hypothetical protein
MATWRGRQRTNLLVFVCCAAFLFIFYGDVLFPTGRRQTPSIHVSSDEPAEVLGEDSVELVVASMTKENVTWLNNYLTHWKKSIYVVDDPKSALTVPVNKGREAMVFLTYVSPEQDPLRGERSGS